MEHVKHQHSLNRVSFGSKLGMVAAAAGSAVGLGNIWRFPSSTADGGGAVFILVYLVCILLIGIPMMMAEFVVGRAGKANASMSFRVLAPGTQWKWVGRLGILTAFLILGFYSVVCGWTLWYFIQSVSGQLASVTDYAGDFSNLAASFPIQVALMATFAILTGVFVNSGVKKGIEKSAKLLMPVLFLLLIVLAIRSITLEGAGEGLSFLFHPDFSKLNGSTFLSALGQSFFSLSLGMGIMITYGSYFKQDAHLFKTAAQVSLLDTLVAILAGLVIFPAAFALAPDKAAVTQELVKGGPGLLFITVPGLFKSLPLSSLWSSIFFFLIMIAALTSTISLTETCVVFVHERFKLSRSVGTIIVTAGVIILGLFCSYSMNFFDRLDFLTAKIMLPLGGLLVSIFVGWFMQRKLVEAELTSEGRQHWSIGMLKTYTFLVRFIAPIAIIAIFIYGLA